MTSSRTSAGCSSMGSFSRSWLARPSFRSSGCSAARCPAPCQRITAQARQLQTLAEPELVPVTSYIKEIHELGSTMNLAQRAIWSFAHFVPKEIVRGLIDNSISTRLGGVKAGHHAGIHRRPGLHDHCGGGRSRRADAADVAVLLRADGSVPRRGRHGRQVHRRRRHGVLECPQSASRTTSRAPAGRCSRPRLPVSGLTPNSRPMD